MDMAEKLWLLREAMKKGGHFCADVRAKAYLSCQQLEEQGLMVEKSFCTNTAKYFAVTAEGRQFLQKHSACG